MSASEEYRVVWRINTQFGNETLTYECPTLEGAAVIATMHPSDVTDRVEASSDVVSVAVQSRFVPEWVTR